jgi:hypothetical protein
MSTVKRVAAAAALIAMPLVAFAQSETIPSQDSLSRTQVKRDQLNVERAGYTNDAGDQTSYPQAAQAAESRIGAQQVRDAQGSGYGGVVQGSTAYGAPGSIVQPAHTAGAPGTKGVYFGQ